MYNRKYYSAFHNLLYTTAQTVTCILLYLLDEGMDLVVLRLVSKERRQQRAASVIRFISTKQNNYICEVSFLPNNLQTRWFKYKHSPAS